VVTYTPNAGYVGPDTYCLSCTNPNNAGHFLTDDGALHSACYVDSSGQNDCNLNAVLSVTAPPLPIPTLGTWAMLLMALLLVAMTLYRFRVAVKRRSE
jgi:hypothetical protein